MIKHFLQGSIVVVGLLFGMQAVGQEILAQERWPDGTLRATRYTDGSRIHFITYHENGLVKEMGTFVNGRRDGVWKQYSDTGALVARAGFKNGERQGLWEFRTMADKPMGRLLYRDGALLRSEALDEEGAVLTHRSY